MTTLIDKVAKLMADGSNAHEIAAIVGRPIKQVRHAMSVIRYPEIESARQAAYYAKRRGDPVYMESRRKSSRLFQARRRGSQVDENGYAIVDRRGNGT